MGPELCRIAFLDKSYIADSSSPSITAEDFIMGGGGGVTPLCAPTPLCQKRVCLTRGVSPGAYRGAQGRSLKNTWKMFVFNCMIHFVTCIVTTFPITDLLGYP